MSTDLQWKEAFIQIVAGSKSAEEAIKKLGVTTRKSGTDVGFLTKQMNAFASSTLSQLRSAVMSYVGVGVAIGFVTSKINEMREAEKKRAEQAKALSTSIHRGAFADPVGATSATATAADVFGLDRAKAGEVVNAAAAAYSAGGGRGGLPSEAANRAVHLFVTFDKAGLDGLSAVKKFAELLGGGVPGAANAVANAMQTGGDLSKLNRGNAVLYGEPGGVRNVALDAEIQAETLRREEVARSRSGAWSQFLRFVDPMQGIVLDAQDERDARAFEARTGTETVGGRIQRVEVTNPDLKAQGN
jgi:hypothetical protein